MITKWRVILRLADGTAHGEVVTNDEQPMELFRSMPMYGAREMHSGKTNYYVERKFKFTEERDGMFYYEEV